MYNVDIDTLISVLSNRRINGYLRTDLSTGGFTGSLGKGYAIVTLENGTFKSLVIYDAHDLMLFQGNEALSKIRKKILAWDLVETPAAQEPLPPKSATPPVRISGQLQSPPVRTSGQLQPPSTRISGQLQPQPGRTSGQLQPPPAMHGETNTYPALRLPMNNGARSLNTLVPGRYQELSPMHLQYMSRGARGIYALVNGTNTVERIAHLLSLPVEVVYRELVAMQNNSLIVFI